MRDTDAPQSPDTRHPAEPGAALPHAEPQTVRDPHAAPASPKPLSMFLKVSIALLIGLTLASISLLFIGDFEGKFERVFSTFMLFAVFVTFTAIDTSRERKSDWYAPVALIANTYILGLLLIVIWMTPYHSYSLLAEIFWKSFLVILVTRLVILCCELLLIAGGRAGETATRFAFVTSVLAVLSGILFTAPVGIEAFSLHIPDLYWKIATAVLILTALGLSVTLLLGWAHKADARAERRAAGPVAGGPRPYVAQAPYGRAAQYPVVGAHPGAYPAGQPGTVQDPYAAAGAQVQDPHVAQDSHAAGVQPQQGIVLPPAAPAATTVAPAAPAVTPDAPAAQQEPELLPWPTFADGTPIPAGPDGQPDFSVPGAPAPPQW